MKKRHMKQFLAILMSVFIISPAILTTLALQSDNMNEEEQIVDFPKSMMSVSANSYQPGQNVDPENVIDGNTGTIWHSQWAPEDTFPHILTVDLHKTAVLNGYINLSPA